MAMISVSE